MILQIALDTPVRRRFDYLPPVRGEGTTGSSAGDEARFKLGVRVSVPFGRRVVQGVLVGVADSSPLPAHKLRAALAVIDAEPVFDPVTLELLCWAAEYYHHPIGEVFAAALPASLRGGQATVLVSRRWELTPSGRAQLDDPTPRPRGREQRRLMVHLATHGPQARADLLAEFRPAPLRALAARGWIAATTITAPAGALTPAAVEPAAAPGETDPGVTLTDAQQEAVARLQSSLGRFAAFLLFGVTGSGKTEVYLRLVAQVIAAGDQALVLVPEIALTPQLVARFAARFRTGVAVLHSGLPGAERRDAWRDAHNGHARIVLGTRSAVFASLPRLALIIVDEEHDASYKQQEGFRYSARDLAVLRAQRAGVPIVLGSATPSLETLENVAQGRYTRLSLPGRPGAARAPLMRLIDLKSQAAENGLSQLAMSSIRRHLDAGAQVIVFLNRRGYAPTLFCNHCGWVAPCAHCDARMTLHRRAAQLRCHHCGAHGPVPLVCGGCGHALLPVGQGTERVEETLQRLFPDAPLARLDRDTAGARGGAQGVLARVHSGEARILVGTQMLTKGHHFPDVSLVVILDADQGLFASDYRATERLAQTIVQVAGRAGRAARAGEVLIQTQFPEHPLLNRLIKSGYEEFAAAALAERREANWPPFSRLALLRAEARQVERVEQFLQAAAALARDPGIKLLGPASALLARRADHFRAHLLVEAAERGELQRFLARWLAGVAALPTPAGLRWSIDVDPLEVD
jgi:primosomal protein N' (replication factor Y)